MILNEEDINAAVRYHVMSEVSKDYSCVIDDRYPKWISIKDRLPESSGLKVVVSAKTVPESVLQTKAVFVAFLGYGDGEWYTPDVDFMTSAKIQDNHVHPVWEITHWMPLPEPPKEEKSDEA